ncbi:hypothetical protein GCM10007858_50910 [Bradyrhizobium liaoningense]|nr:hypothetical protein GCM10007858_50910 [Bradyrhizobium liaoningense]
MIKPVAPTLMDRFLAGVAPNFATRRYHARLSLNYMGQYAGARSNELCGILGDEAIRRRGFPALG